MNDKTDTTIEIKTNKRYYTVYRTDSEIGKAVFFRYYGSLLVCIYKCVRAGGEGLAFSGTPGHVYLQFNDCGWVTPATAKWANIFCQQVFMGIGNPMVSYDTQHLSQVKVNDVKAKFRIKNGNLLGRVTMFCQRKGHDIVKETFEVSSPCTLDLTDSFGLELSNFIMDFVMGKSIEELKYPPVK